MPTAAVKLTDDESLEKPFVEVALPRTKHSVDASLLKIVAATKSSPLSVTRDYVGLAFGPGKISFKDYTELRLFDRVFWGEEDRRTVAGARRIMEIFCAINYRQDWWGLIENKIATCSDLAAYGMPTTPMLAVYCDNLTTGANNIASDERQLRDFLVDETNYPMFGKPIEALQSLGSIGLKRYLPQSESLETCDGRLLPLGEFISLLRKHYAAGYIFQKLMSPHAAIRALCGNRLATVRVVTLANEAGPKVFRACWKIPAGVNTADNYWRKGNLLAQIDITEGQVLRVLSGKGLDLVQHDRHPDSGAPLIGFRLPHWQRVLDTAIEAGRLMRHVPLIGWDIAVVDEGPVIIEMNQCPDLVMAQLADARGILQPELKDFMQVQQRKCAEYKKTIEEINKQTM
jgi:hypothetical protein